jgi:hypothetical protein
MLLVQLGINSTRDVWKFAKLDSPRRLVQFLAKFPNITRTINYHAIAWLPILIALVMFLVEASEFRVSFCFIDYICYFNSQYVSFGITPHELLYIL